MNRSVVVRARTPFRKGGTRLDRYSQAVNSWACKYADCLTIHHPAPNEVKATEPAACDGCGRSEFWELGSGIEAQRFGTLAILQGQGKISNLEAQRTFDLPIDGKPLRYPESGRKVTWRCDFIYRDEETGLWTVEDVKAHGAPMDPVSKIKHALFDACYRDQGMHVSRVYI